MQKAERLLKMITFLSRAQGAALTDLQQRFGVSERTVYRDLRSLSRLKIPLHYDRGYHVRGRWPKTRDWSRDERQLLEFCLLRGPLTRYPYFGQQLLALAQSLGLALPNSDALEGPGLFAVNDAAGPGHRSGHRVDRLLRVVLPAMRAGGTLALRLCDGREMRRVTPLAIVLDDKLRLRVKTGARGIAEVLLENIRSVRPNR